MIEKFIEIVNSPIKSTVTVVTGTATGYLPNLGAIMANNSISNIDTYFQHAVWAITILVGITALVSWCQKQIDRYKKLRKERKDNEYNFTDDED